MKDAAILRGVNFTYPDATEPAIVDATFAIPEGALVLMAGATGAGKSTLLRTLNGLVPHFTGGSFTGSVTIHGRDTLEHAPRQLADLVGFVPQDPGAAFVLDRVEDELAYGMENLGVAPEVMRRRVEETMDLLAIEGLRARSVRTLSGGERQRVAIAAAMAPGPRVLLLDEPTSQLDPQAAEDVVGALQRLVHDLGITVVVAEHRLERVAGFADLAIACRVGRPPVFDRPDNALAALDHGPPVARLGRLLGWQPVPLTVRTARWHASDMVVPSPVAPALPVPGDVLVRAEGLIAGYEDIIAVRDVTIELRRGEVVALMGRNGSGKTTLLRCLAGLHEPRRGTVMALDGPPRPGVDVALCPQTPESVLFKDTAAGEVDATYEATGRSGDAVAALERFGVGESARRHPRDLSAGERLLVATAAIAATGAPVLLLDEPTRGLDPASKKRLARALTEHASQGGAVMIATHDPELVAEVATRVVMLAGGEMIADGATGEVLGDSPVFAPQTTRVFGPGWLTPEQVAAAVEAGAS